MNNQALNGQVSKSNQKVINPVSFSNIASNSDMSTIISIMERLLHWAAVVESSDDAVISKSVDGDITGWNAAAQRLYGYTAEEIIGKPVSILMPPQKEDDFVKIMKLLRAGKKVEHYETKRKTKDGRIIDVSITVSPIKDSSGKLIGASKIARDISDRKQNERRRDEFMSTVSHELKTPISSQKIYGELLEQQITKNGDLQYAELIQKINRQTAKLEKLVNDLLELSRIHAGKVKMELVKFKLDKLVADVVEDMQEMSLQHKININAKSVTVQADRDRIAQVIGNLLSNAIKYSPEANKIEVGVDTSQNEAVVSIKDFGIGIGTEFTSKIFERFFRINEEDETTFPGMGIGLNFSREIIELHNGKIWVESKAGVGSTFYFSLPLRQNESSRVRGRL